MKLHGETKELLSGSMISLTAKGADLVLRYVLISLLARILGAEMLGRYTLVLGVLLVFVEIGRAGMDAVMLKLGSELYSQGKFEELKQLYKQLSLILLGIGTILTLFLFTFAPFIATTLLSKPYLTTSLQYLSLGIIPYLFLFLHSQGMRALKNILAYSLAMDVALPLLSILLIVALRSFISPEALVILFIVGSAVITSATILPVWLRFSKFFKTVYSSTNYSKQIWTIARPFISSILASLTLNWAAIFIIGGTAATIDVAVFNIAYKVALLASIPLIAIETASSYQIAASFKNNDLTTLKRHTQKATALTVLLAIPIIAFLVLFGKPLLTFFGNDFTSSYNLMLVMLLGQCFNVITGPVSLVLTMTNKQNAFRNIFIFSAVLTLVLNYFFIRYWGLYGAAWSNVISIVVKNLLFYLAVKKHFGFSSFSLTLIKEKLGLLKNPSTV